MKKTIALALALAASAAVAAPDPEANRQIKSLKSRVAAAEAGLDAVEVVAAAALPQASLAVADTNVTVVSTTHVPAFRGQLLVGTVSNKVWAAGNTTTNGWILLN